MLEIWLNSWIYTNYKLVSHKFSTYDLILWPTVTEFRGPHGMEEGKGERYLASGRQYGNALLRVRHQEEEDLTQDYCKF